MPSENTILNLFRRPFSFFNNSTFHYRLRTRRQKAARFRLPKHIMVEHSQPDGLVSRYEYDSYDPLAQVCNWTSMSTVRRGCITTSSGIMSLMQGGVNQNLIGLDGGDNLYLFAFNSHIWVDALGLPKAPWGKDSFDSWFDSANVADIRKVMANPNTKNAIPNALRNSGGLRIFLKSLLVVVKICWGLLRNID